MQFGLMLYGLALILFIYIVFNIIRTKKFNTDDAIATLGIIVSILLALNVSPPTIPLPVAPTNKSTSTPKLTESPPFTAIPSQFNTLVFSDNFENGNRNFLLGGGSGSFNVVDDGTGNNVLELSDAGVYSLLVTFGPKNISDFAIEYRVKIISFDSKQNDSGVANLKRYTNFGGSEYTFSFDLHYQYPQFYYFSPYEKIQGADYKIVNNKWYNIRVEMDGENLFASIDGVPVLKTTDSRLSSGNLGFQIYSNTTVDFDDVKIWTR